MKSSKSLLSIIVPTFNRRKLLARTLVEVFAEPLPGKQIIVVDDGSTDGTAEYLSSIPVTTVHHPRPSGPAVARNAGIAEATGKYLFFLDSDDLLEPFALTNLVEFLERHPEHAAVGGQLAGVIDEHGACLATGFTGADALGNQLSMAEFQRGKKPIAGVCRYLWRSDFVRALGAFDPALKESGEDWDFLIRAVKRQPIPLLNVPLIWRRCHSDNLTKARWTEQGLAVDSRCVAQNHLVSLSHGLPLSFKS